MIELRRRYSGSKGSDSPSFSRLPKEYQEVEWIRPSVKGAYINTGIIPNDNLDFNVKFSAYTYEGIQMIFGTKDPQYRIYFVATNNSIESQFPKWGTYYWISDNAGFGVYTFSKEGALFKLNDLHYNYAISGIESTSHIHLFHSASEGGYYSTNYLYYASFKDNGVIVREFIPCYRISDRKPGMYDIVNDVFYTNAGTGEFLYGQDVHYNIPFEYQEVEWLQNGNDNANLPYIKTNILPTHSLCFDFECAMPTAPWKDNNRYDYLFMGAELNCYSDVFSLGFNNTNAALFYGLYARIGINGYQGITGILPESNAFVRYSYFNGTFYVNKEAILTNLYGSLQLPIYLFATNRNGTPLCLQSGIKFKTITFYDGDKTNVIARFIPCYRKSDNEAGMYDLVSGEFYTNAGTGVFEVGPLVI